ncbi:MAG TPA: universal stress protein [Gemmatimonadaceae bacterium]|nr:universal stress protein [Gemmatimonadaceae bacterium]
MTATRPTRAPRRNANTIRQPYRILVGASGEPSSLGALRVAQALARRRSASVHALSVATPFPHRIPTVFNVAPPALIDEDSRRGALEQLRTQLAAVRGTRGWTMRATVGFAADSIVDAAERWPASLVIIGLGHHGFADRLIGSETAVTVAKRCKVPVLAVPPDATQLPMRAVAAIDFTDESVEAAMLAATMLGPNGQLTLIHASVLAVDEGKPGSLLDVYTSGAKMKLHEIEDRVHRRTKRRVSSVVAGGDIVERLVQYAADERCDLIALGGPEHDMLERLLAGSVRTRVLRAVGCAVLIAPARRTEG